MCAGSVAFVKMGPHSDGDRSRYAARVRVRKVDKVANTVSWLGGLKAAGIRHNKIEPLYSDCRIQ